MDILVVLIALLCVLFVYMKYLKSRRLPPGPWGLPVLGYLPWIDRKKPYATLTELAGKYGPIYSMSMGSVLTVVLSDPQLIREALSKDVFTARADLYLTHGMMDGYGLIASEGDKWKEQRRFVASFLKGLGVVKVGSKRAVMEERILVGLRESIKMFNDLNGKATDPNDILLQSLGNVINLIVFGKMWSYEDEEWIWLRERLKEGVKLIGVAGPINFLPFLRWWPGYAPTLRYLVEGKRKTHLLYEKIAQEKEDGEDLISSYKTAISKNAGKYFDRKQMYHVLADMFGAGSDTSLTTVRWFLLFVAANPKIQEKLHKEIDSVLGQRKEICLNDMEFMPYTMASLYESQRIRSIVPLGIPHGTWEKTSLSGYEIPARAMILPLQWAVHMNPSEFPNPEEFLPERFLNEEGKLIKKHDFFLPFQCGKRVCIGEEMAKMMMFIFGAGLLSEFSISVLEEGQELKKALDGVCGLTFGPGDHKIIFKKRNKNL